MFTAVRGKSQLEAVTDAIRSKIHLAELAPGIVLPSERTLSAQFDVSRSTLREAIKILIIEGYLLPDPKSTVGPRVSDRLLTRFELIGRALRHEEQIMDALDFRLAVEPGTARLAVKNITDEHLTAMRTSLRQQQQARSDDDRLGFRKTDIAFHQTIVDATYNEFLSESVKEARSLTFFLVDALEPDINHPNTLNAHEAVLDAVAHRDAEQADAAMRNHIMTTITEVEQAMANWKIEYAASAVDQFGTSQVVDER